MKKLMSIILSVAMLFSLSATVLASENGTEIRILDNEHSTINFDMALADVAYYNNADLVNDNEWELVMDAQGDISIYNQSTSEEIVSAWEFDANGVLVEVDLVEHFHFLNASYIDIEESVELDFTAHSFEPFFNPPVYRTYRETSRSRVIAPPFYVTPEGRGPGKIFAVQAPVRDSFSVNATVTFRGLITAGASFNWNSMLNTSGGAVYDVPAGRVGRIRFTPFLNRTDGVITETVTGVSTKTYNVWGTSPIRLASNAADGRFELVLVR